ncbi:cytochrome c oxidase subunit 4 [Georgenia alba]|uniref:cytochrome-c oxidase n=1 Tax=Georgenia alba TaxID=2233858 RepID=A0ABW2QAB7_9MICO
MSRDSQQSHETERPSKPLAIEAWLFLAGVFAFIPVAVIYGFVADWEPVGTTGLFLLAALSALAGGYLWITGRRIDMRPEDNPTADIDERAGEVGVFSPHSWWPLVLGIATTLGFLGLAIGWWMVGLGMFIGLVGLVGLLFEFYRGQHAH